MKPNFFDRLVVGLVTLFLGMIAFRPWFTPRIMNAQWSSDHLYIEPGVTTLFAPDRSRQVQGKVVVDLTTGNIWGFPTSPDVPYPIEWIKAQPATSSPIYLGKFDLARMQH